MKKLFFALCSIRLIPAYLLYKASKNRAIITADVIQNEKQMIRHGAGFFGLMREFNQFRNIVYYRLGPLRYLVMWLCPKNPSVEISTANVGAGLCIGHAAGCRISGIIGKNATVFQNVTIGELNGGYPVIGDNVTIRPGAIVCGAVKIGDNCIIGAMSYINKDVPANTIIHAKQELVSKAV